MRKILWLVLLAASLWSSGQAFGQSQFSDDCAAWKITPDYVKSGIVMGWIRGIDAADALTSEEILSRLWPKGHRVGSVVTEINVSCRVPEIIWCCSPM
jgi:hypothetical protein